MGTTLENGVYLPSEGERNCYAGLKTNWEILDQKVADVTALQQAVAGALHREIVESLPTTDIDPNTIYMILSGTSATENVYNEFMYVNNAWELIGTSATDLTNYYTKAEVDGKLLLKASASDLTSHTGDTTIHVTANDKNRWNNNTYVFRYSSTALVASSTNSNTLLDNTDNLKVGDKVIDSSGVLFSITAIDSQNSTFTIGTALIDLAQDSDVVHKSGNETVGGIKNFTDYTYIRALNFTNEVASPSSSDSAIMPIVTTVTYTDQSPSQTARLNFRITADGTKSLYPHENNQYFLGLASRRWNTLYSYLASLGGTYLGNESSSNERTNLYLLANRDSDGQSGAYITRFRQNRAQGEMVDGDFSFVSFSFLENSIRSRGFDFGLTDWVNGEAQTYYFTSPTNKGSLGTSNRKWQKINGLNPSALGMPDLNNGIDISSYITHLDKVVNQYTPPVNGYINIRVKKTSLPIISIRIQQYYGLMNSSETADFSTWGTCLPVVAGQIVEVYISADSLMSAIFFPCQGNV